MQIERVVTAAAAAFVVLLGSVAAQQPPAAPTQPPAAPPQTPAAPAPAAGGARLRPQGRGRVATFPAQQRPPGDPALIERGKTLYSVDLQRLPRRGRARRPARRPEPSALAARAERSGRRTDHADRQGRARRARHAADSDAGRGHQGGGGVPAQPAGRRSPAGRTAGERGAASERARRRRRGRRKNISPPSAARCHSPTGDLQGIATRVPDAEDAADRLGRRGRRRRRPGGAAAAAGKPVTATITLPSGEKVEGRLVRIDHFLVTVALPTTRCAASIATAGPKVEITRSAGRAQSAALDAHRQGHARRHRISRDTQMTIKKLLLTRAARCWLPVLLTAQGKGSIPRKS